MTLFSNSRCGQSSRSLLIEVQLEYAFAQETDVLLQVEAAAIPGQTVASQTIDFGPLIHSGAVPGHAGLGQRRWLRVADSLCLAYAARIDLDRKASPIDSLGITPPHLLPGAVIDYLMPSRYCPSDQFHQLVSDEFETLEGGARAAAMSDWIGRNLQYSPGASDQGTTAADTLISRRGVCRDYAHLLIAMARAAWIPARYVSVYAPGVSPPDFHAVVELYLGESWILVDPTGMASPEEMVIIGCGRDAADVPFLSSFGDARFVSQNVAVTRLGTGQS